MFSKRQALALAFGLLLVASMVAVRWESFDQPHWGIDEGVTFTIGQQIAEGDVLYRDAVDHRTPLVPYLKALVFLVAGDWNIFAVRFAAAVMLGLGSVLLWRIGRRLGDEATGVAAAVLNFFALNLLIGLPDGPAVHTAWFVIFFSSVGFWCFARAIGQPSFRSGLVVGLAFGLGAMCKQPALLDFGVTWVLIALIALKQPADRRALARLFAGQLLGAALPFAAFAGYFAAHGLWSDFVYYAFTYNTAVYIPAGGEFEYLPTMAVPFELAWRAVPPVAILAVGGALGLIGLAFTRLFKPQPLAVLPWLILGWAATGILSTALSGRTFAHYSVQVLPGLSLAAGWSLARLYRLGWAQERFRLLWRFSFVATCLAIAFTGIPRWVAQYQRMTAWESYGENVGSLIRRFTTPAERVFVWGYFPEYHLLAQRLPATRFVYSNFLTGFVPWADMDAFIPTDRWITPEAWDDLRSDFTAHPPALIVDQRLERAQAKYQLFEHEQIWSEVTHRYAQLPQTSVAGSVRFFRRLDDEPVPLAEPSSLPVAPELQLAVEVTWRSNEVDSLRLDAPAGWSHFSIWVDGGLFASLPYPADHDVSWKIWDGEDVLSQSTDIRVVGRRADGTFGVSPPLHYAPALAAAESRRGPLPVLQFNGVPVTPFEASMEVDDLSVDHTSVPGSVIWAAPGRLVYPSSPYVRRLNIQHGLLPHLYDHSDGYDIQINWLPSDGAESFEVWRTRLAIREEGRFRSTQQETIELPPRGPGRLEIRFLSGRRSDPQLDYFFFGDDSVAVPMPRIYVDGAPVTTSGDVIDDAFTDWVKNSDEGWLLHAPKTLELRLPHAPELAAVTFTYGVEDGAWQPGGGETDGVTFKVWFRPDAVAERRLLFERHLDPRQKPEDRGPQSLTLPLPSPTGEARLSIETSEGPHGNGAWDWSWVSDLTATTAEQRRE